MFLWYHKDEKMHKPEDIEHSLDMVKQYTRTETGQNRKNTSWPIIRAV